ncbi:polysaccharide deacetylase family protein [Duganella sp. FT92W]|uniref:Polysaccharide deacetylase family protein n=1 Tax=Pseudoduganella rivuli TaxID=2666085 RepID=A0A7X2IUM5_9BURK|nr:polysaccharide deacetylase family protein [Pseudoduganella rivuli]MRV76422.1 polysaccharide deacetylase family protein [Pseudoduganella rivuli]
MRTRVCITIDMEFSIGGAFNDPSCTPVAEPAVWCNSHGRSEGLGYMLDTFRKYHVPATFFVETVQRTYFRHDPMRDIVHRVYGDGHEVQLHSHPCWTLFRHSDWRSRLPIPEGSDNFHGRAVEDSMSLIQQGIDTFSDWGMPRPKAFRSGNLQHDDNLYRALAQKDIPYASNVGVAIFDSGDPNYALYSGRHERHGVQEYPVLTFSDWNMGGRQHLKSLTIAGTSFQETVSLLEDAHAMQIPLVVVLTHPFEFVHRRDVAFTQLGRHHLTQRRLLQLCQFLDRHSDRFEASGFAAAATACEHAPSRNTLLKTNLGQSLLRMASQVTHDKLGNLMTLRSSAT